MNAPYIEAVLEKFANGKQGSGIDELERLIAEHWLGFTGIVQSPTNGGYIGFDPRTAKRDNRRREALPRYQNFDYRDWAYWRLLQESQYRPVDVAVYFWNRIGDRLLERKRPGPLPKNSRLLPEIADMVDVRVEDAIYAAAMTASEIQSGRLDSTRFHPRPSGPLT